MLEKLTSLSNKKLYFFIFAAFFLIRLLFILVSGYSNFELQPDSRRYDLLSSQLLKGNYNMNLDIFIVAPLYPYFVALHKLLFAGAWKIALTVSQLTLCALSGIFIFKIARLLFNQFNIAMLSAMIYAVFPMTLWWCHTFSQETLFQCLFIITIFFLLSARQANSLRDLVISAVLFSLTFLTKSHILLFLPFVFIAFGLSKNLSWQRKFYFSAIFTIICLLFTLPYGLYNLKANGMYVISSTGGGAHFCSGHNENVYEYIVNPPPRESEKFKYLYRNYFLPCEEGLGGKANLTHKQRQDGYFKVGMKWVKENPRKFMKLNLMNIYRFLMPGVGKAYYPFKIWLFSFLSSLPIYLLAYLGIATALRRNFRQHFWILGVFIAMLIFSVGFYAQNRFRTITLEPFYIIYASFRILRP